MIYAQTQPTIYHELNFPKISKGTLSQATRCAEIRKKRYLLGASRQKLVAVVLPLSWTEAMG